MKATWYIAYDFDNSTGYFILYNGNNCPTDPFTTSVYHNLLTNDPQLLKVSQSTNYVALNCERASRASVMNCNFKLKWQHLKA